jgi:hypothetical protein
MIITIIIDAEDPNIMIKDLMDTFEKSDTVAEWRKITANGKEVTIHNVLDICKGIKVL